MLLYTLILSITFNFCNFEILPSVRGVWKNWKYFKIWIFKNDGKKLMHSLKQMYRRVEEDTIYFFWCYGSKSFKKGQNVAIFSKMANFSIFCPFEGLKVIISRKKLYSLLLLRNMNVLSYILPFYQHFEILIF